MLKNFNSLATIFLIKRTTNCSLSQKRNMATYRDPFQFLTDDHKSFMGLIDQLLSGDFNENKQETLNSAIKEISFVGLETFRRLTTDAGTHSAAEEMYLYPVLRKHLGDALADRNLKEHTEVKKILSGLDAWS